MKKSIFTFVACLLLAGIASGQAFYSTLNEAHGIKSPGETGTREGVECPLNTFYSHPVNFNTGFTSWTGTQFAVYDQVESTPINLVSTITFFGIFDVTPGRNFQIAFYHDDAGEPGALITSYTTFIGGTNTGQILSGYYSIFNYSYTLPTAVALTAGDWVSVVATDGTDYWYWCSGSGGDGCVFQAGVGNRCDYGDVAFCLSGGLNDVPVSNWSLYIGIGLILVFTLVRFRKLV